MENSTQRTFAELTEEDPCQGCPAPCCRLQISPYKTPQNFADIDHVRFSLLFAQTEMAVAASGEWSLIRWQTCSLFDRDHCACTVHSTPAKPKICSEYNAHNCWYKRNYVGDAPPDIYRLDLRRFEVWVKEIVFDENGAIRSVPSFERSQELLRPLNLDVELRTDSRLVKSSPQRSEGK